MIDDQVVIDYQIKKNKDLKDSFMGCLHQTCARSRKTADRSRKQTPRLTRHSE